MSIQRKRKEKDDPQMTTTRRPSARASGLAHDSTEMRGRQRHEMYETHESREAKMIQYLEVAPYQTRES